MKSRLKEMLARHRETARATVRKTLGFQGFKDERLSVIAYEHELD